MKSTQNWLDEYGESHQNPLNKKIHWVCVPAIMFSLMGLWWSIPHAYMPYIINKLQLNWAIIITALILVYYIRLSKVMAIGMFFIGFSLLAGNFYIKNNFHTPLWKTSLIIFVVAWIGQFIGHKIEGKKPSFFQDIQFLLIGPAWLLSFIYNKLGIKY
ncbi:MAG: DUF962 domain-containing protein [Candidatus Marinimicrobia bacterium]|nr:DUF962 domain-containing protein [Candidatus Neomarinimicrobiota bacterium]